ncbi:glycosyltransferase family 4 protein [Rhizobium etli]|uniref:glycosyltransferase family 4 protein n=1 Tax=Rhizobium etli TaxID=29449 RepID=UPI0003839F87|nr:glycosyltransferase family 4 protein [Rhizobium etli]AGS20638.1 glycosyltransferase protein [Rhizobium etli bv. mimosae str. Mim1]
MRLHYIAPSTLPSRTANSVHVVWQCNGLAQRGADVTLYAKRAMADALELPQAVETTYGVASTAFRFETVYSASTFGDNLRIAQHAVRCIRRAARGDAILSRNLYASFILAVLYRMPLVFETHQLESGMRKWMQRTIVRCRWVTTVLISEHLAIHLEQHLGTAPHRTLILHDAAPEGITPVPMSERRERLCALAELAQGPWKQVCGYFGHLFPGRGIEVVEAMAAARPDVLFLVYGGTEADLNRKRNTNRLMNLSFMGHVSHPMARQLMCLVDVLLMPYQQHVSIGVAGHDTARWMSPMKMFEYLGTGVPIISSDLPVLREVLRNGDNCLLAPPANVEAWTAALEKLYCNPVLAAQIGKTAHIEYQKQHTWTRRAEQILAAVRKL